MLLENLDFQVSQIGWPEHCSRSEDSKVFAISQETKHIGESE
jgi:hypothetical protein